MGFESNGLYNNFDDYDEVYESDEFDEYQERVDMVRGTLSEGPCCYHRGRGVCRGTMHLDGSCFICDSCDRSADEESYYLWYVGGPIDFD